MKKKLSVTAALAAAMTGVAMPAQAQDRIPAVELGIYGGASWSSKWLGINEGSALFAGGEPDSEGFGIGVNPMGGATAAWYFTPMLGLRLHGAYMPSDFPTRDRDASVAAFGAVGPAVTAINGFADDDVDYSLNNYLTDVNLVFRPYATSRSDWLGSTYFFVGGGALITDVSGDADPGDQVDPNGNDCVDAYEPLGACLSHNPRHSTVGQGTAGFGLNFFPLSSRLGLFSEVAVHAYDSPFHVPNENGIVEDKLVWTPRAAIGLKLSLGNLLPPVVVAPPVSVAPAPMPAPMPAPAPETRAVTVCVVQGNALTNVQATYRPAQGDTVLMMNGVERRFSDVHSATAPQYAAGATWYVNNDDVRVQDRQYVRFGVPRVIANTTQLQRVGDFNGVSVFAETGAAAPYSVLYVPLRPGCEFQPFQMREQIRVRG